MSQGLPPVRQVGFGAPFRWLAGGLADMTKAPLACLVYGLGMAAVSIAISYLLYITGLAYWVIVLALGFVFLAPMLAMGLYEAGRVIEAGERPRLGRILFVRGALRQDTCYLGLALLLIFGLWLELGQIIFALSTIRIYDTLPGFLDFALRSDDGHTMLIAGSAVGAVMAFLVFTMAVVSAPMLLDRETNAFAAVATSFRAVNANIGPMLLWAFLIAVLTAIAVATAFIGMIVIFPWLGLASWRAYRGVVRNGA